MPRIGRFASCIILSGAFRPPRSGTRDRISGRSDGSAVSSPASRVVSVDGMSNWTGPGGLAVVTRIARRICWRTVLAAIVVFHFTSGL